MKTKLYYFLGWFWIAVLSGAVAFAQQSSQMYNQPKSSTKEAFKGKIEIIADRTFKDEVRFPDATLLLSTEKPVYVKHNELQLWCEKAVYFPKKEFIQATGKVHIKQGDSISLHCHYAEYDARTPIAFAKDTVHVVHKTNESNIVLDAKQAHYYPSSKIVKAQDSVRINYNDSIYSHSQYAQYNANRLFAIVKKDVVLNSPNQELTTDTLYVDRKRNQTYYQTGGTLLDKAQDVLLKSKIARYFMSSEKYEFKKQVSVINNKDTINTDRLFYTPNNSQMRLFGNSNIITQDNKMYFQRGAYNTKTKTGSAVDKARIAYKNQIITADSIYYDEAKKYATATNNVRILDTVNNLLVLGHYAQIEKAKENLMVTKKPLAIHYKEKDSLYIHADTLLVTGKKKERLIKGFSHVRVLNNDTNSSKCDSVVVSQKTGIIKLLKNPVVWNTKSQIIGDSIQMIQNQNTRKIDSILVQGNAFVARKDTIGDGFNQVKGQLLKARLKDSRLEDIVVEQEVESLFYQRDEKDLSLTGITKVKSQTAQVLFEDKKIADIYYYTDVDGAFLKQEDIPKRDRLLNGFSDRFDEQISEKKMLFPESTQQDKGLELPKIKGIPLPNDEDQEVFFTQELLEELLKDPKEN